MEWTWISLFTLTRRRAVVDVARITHPMTPPGPLQVLHDLDRTSPQFYKQLSDLLRGDEYRNVVLDLQGDDTAWLVEYLDNVSLQPSFPHLLQPLCRSLQESQTIKVSNLKNSCKNSEIYVALRGFCHNLVCLWTSRLPRPPQMTRGYELSA